jgi:hypothetical protein
MTLKYYEEISKTLLKIINKEEDFEVPLNNQQQDQYASILLKLLDQCLDISFKLARSENKIAMSMFTIILYLFQCLIGNKEEEFLKLTSNLNIKNSNTKDVNNLVNEHNDTKH